MVVGLVAGSGITGRGDLYLIAVALMFPLDWLTPMSVYPLLALGAAVDYDVGAPTRPDMPRAARRKVQSYHRLRLSRTHVALDTTRRFDSGIAPVSPCRPRPKFCPSQTLTACTVTLGACG